MRKLAFMFIFLLVIGCQPHINNTVMVNTCGIENRLSNVERVSFFYDPIRNNENKRWGIRVFSNDKDMESPDYFTYYGKTLDEAIAKRELTLKCIKEAK